MLPSELATACAFKPSVTALNCREHTESTSGTSRLNSSKHPQAPEDAKPGVSERFGDGSRVIKCASAVECSNYPTKKRLAAHMAAVTVRHNSE